MNIQFKCFGQLIDVIGKSELEIPEITDTDLLMKKMLKDFPKLSEYNFLISVNKKLVKEKQLLKSGDEVAFLPPFAGG